MTDKRSSPSAPSSPNPRGDEETQGDEKRPTPPPRGAQAGRKSTAKKSGAASSSKKPTPKKSDGTHSAKKPAADATPSPPAPPSPVAEAYRRWRERGKSPPTAASVFGLGAASLGASLLLIVMVVLTRSLDLPESEATLSEIVTMAERGTTKNEILRMRAREVIETSEDKNFQVRTLVSYAEGIEDAKTLLKDVGVFTAPEDLLEATADLIVAGADGEDIARLLAIVPRADRTRALSYMYGRLLAGVSPEDAVNQVISTWPREN